MNKYQTALMITATVALTYTGTIVAERLSANTAALERYQAALETKDAALRDAKVERESEPLTSVLTALKLRAPSPVSKQRR